MGKNQLYQKRLMLRRKKHKEILLNNFLIKDTIHTMDTIMNVLGKSSPSFFNCFSNRVNTKTLPRMKDITS